jgi:hypothetical protein
MPCPEFRPLVPSRGSLGNHGKGKLVGAGGGSKVGRCGRGARPPLLLAAIVLVIALLGPASNALGAEASGGISGEVTEAVSHVQLQGIEVCAFSTNFELFNFEELKEHYGCTTTGPGGQYTISGLLPESYFVAYGAPEESKLNYITQYYDGKLMWSEADSVVVAAEKTTANIDAELSPGAEITGTVTDAETGAPIAKAFVFALMPNARGLLEPVAFASSEANGEYAMRGLASGSYKLAFFAPGFELQYYDNGSSEAEAESVSLKAPGLTTGIDDALKAASASPGPVGATPEESPLGSKVPGGLTPSSSSSAEATVSLAGKRIAVERNGDALVKISCAGAVSCHAKLTLKATRMVKVKGKRTLRTVTIGTSAILSVAAGGKVTAKIKLDAAGRGLLSAARGRLSVELALVSIGQNHDERVVLVKQKGRAIGIRATS